MSDNAPPALPTPMIASILGVLERFCRSDELSIDALRSILRPWTNAGLPSDSSLLHRVLGRDTSLLHLACKNKNVTLEIVECILDVFPTAASFRIEMSGGNLACPLYAACANENCPGSVIELLAKTNPDALRHICVVALPLHIYLLRKSNVDLDTVKVLVEEYPEALTTSAFPTESGIEQYCSMMGGINATHLPREETALNLLLCNPGVALMPEIVQYLVDMKPSLLQKADGHGLLPLHIALMKKEMRVEIVKILVDCWPESVRQTPDDWGLPIHFICRCEGIDDAAALGILNLLIEMYPESVMERDNDGYLPIHWAALSKSPELCKVLIDAHPESLEIEVDGKLPIHKACSGARVDTASYLLELYPERTNARSSEGLFPIHYAVSRRYYKEKAEMIEFLLTEDPDAASKTSIDGDLPLHWACYVEEASPLYLETVQSLFDAHPEGIHAPAADGATPLDIARGGSGNGTLVTFLETQLAYARQAQDGEIMSGNNGILPLHNALKEKAPLGAIKLLVRGNPVALQVADSQGMLPLHVACSCAAVGVVRFLAEPFDRCLNVCDVDGNSPLHLACRSGNCDVVKYLLEKQTPAISQRNDVHKLPIQLLFEAGEVEESRLDCNRTNYTEAIWLLLLAYPEIVMTH